MIYEILLTDSCNRKCPFCYIKDTEYIETLKNVELFISLVKKETLNNSKKFDLNIFGGEPFLNFEAIKMICERFRNDWKCNLNIISNGDLIEDWMKNDISCCHLHLSTYDIFDVKKRARYVEISKIFKKTTFLYTITSMDVYRFDELRDIYDKIGLDYHIHLSHDPCSWKDIKPEKLYDIIYTITKSELDRYLKSYSNINPRGRNFVDQYLLRYICHIAGMDVSKSYCTSDIKKTFYKGKFIGPCVRLEGVKLEYHGKKCSGCLYEKMCSRGCFTEIKDDIDGQLCILEKARFSAIADFLKSENPIIPQIEAFYVDLSKNV